MAKLQVLGIKIEQRLIKTVSATIADNQKREAQKREKQEQSGTVEC